MLKKFLQFVSSNQLFNPDSDKILLAVSGGPDSVVMCDLAFRASLKFAICHINFQLRGEDSLLDEVFVKSLAEKYNVKFFVKRFDTLKYALENNLSVEMAARELRYAEFQRIMKDDSFLFTAVAHQKDDAIETFFLNLLRGAGINGLTGIKLKNDKIIRPLLCFSRQEIMDYIKIRNLSFRIDKTNYESEFSRNKIRNKIIPLFEQINPSFKNNVALSLNFLSSAKNIYQFFINQKKDEILHHQNDGSVIVKIADILSFVEPECLVFEIFNGFGFNRQQCAEAFRMCFSKESGKKFFSDNFFVLKDRDSFIINKLQQNDNNFDNCFLSLDDVFLSEKQIGEKKLRFSIIEKSDFSPVRDSKTAYFDFEKLKFPLEISKWHSGDFFVPFGLKNKKKLSDFFVDNKLSVSEKHNVRLLKSSDVIIWIIGFRQSEKFKVTRQTKKILKITVE